MWWKVGETRPIQERRESNAKRSWVHGYVRGENKLPFLLLLRDSRAADSEKVVDKKANRKHNSTAC